MLNTIDIVEHARKSPLERSVEQHAEAIAQEINRFTQATSALLVRVIVALLALPAAAVFFLGLPILPLAVGFSLLEEDGIDLERTEISWLTLEIELVVLLVVIVVFVRACWAHRREPGSSWIWAPWLVVGVLLNAGCIAALAIELAPKNSLNPEIHAFFLLTCFAWWVVTMSWAIGRLTSRLFRRLERTHPSNG